jgi:hypothetical protein
MARVQKAIGQVLKSEHPIGGRRVVKQTRVGR